jgi:hypothetical protein
MAYSTSNFLESKLRSLVTGGQLWAQRPSAFYFSLHTADPTDGTTTEGLAAKSTEVVGNGYARTSVACNNTNWTVAKNVVTNAAAISGGANATAAWGTITHVGIYDAAKGGNLLFSAALDEAIDVPAFGSVSFDAGDVTLTLAVGYGEVTACKLLRYLFQNASYTSPSAFYASLGANADAAALYGEPVTQGDPSGSTTPANTGYTTRGSIANAVGNFPASSNSPSISTNSAAIANFPKALTDWGTFSYFALLDGNFVTGKTFAQTLGVITVTSAAHGLGATSNLPSNPGLGSLSGTFSNDGSGVCTVTLPVGHGFNPGDLVCLTFGSGPTSARLTVVSVTATTIVVNSGYNTVSTGTVTAAWPLYVDLYFQSVTDGGGSTPTFPVSRRYLVKAITGTGSFTVDADLSQTVTSSTLAWSGANVILFNALVTPVTIRTNDTTSLPVGALTVEID